MVANIPSSIIVTRVGAPAWLAFLMLSWGIVSACTAAVRTRAQFFCIRVLLGITEAGCFPGARAQPVVQCTLACTSSHEIEVKSCK